MPQNKITDFVERENIARFKALLETEMDPDRREILIRLLAEEEAKHAAHIKARAINLLLDLDAAMRGAKPDQIISVSYDIHASLFPPGEPDQDARERAYNFAKQRGFVMENRIVQAHFCFKKAK